MTELRLERVAHGGLVVGRSDGKVTFVTGGLPGELVRIDVLDEGTRFNRGRVVEVLEAAPGRVAASCPIAGECGGCDWQHADAATQLDLKTAVVAEQVSRLAGIEWDERVQAVEGGLNGWRTRMRYARDGGALGFRARRSHEVVPLPSGGCELAAPGPSVAELKALGGSGDIRVTVADDSVTIMADGMTVGPAVVRQRVLGRIFEVSADGFWQVHPEAARVLTEAVLEGLSPSGGDVALDLYCGAGLFAGALVDAGCRVTGVESSREAIVHARRNVPGARFVAAPVEGVLKGLPQRADVVVLDPPRKGAGKRVVDAVVARHPRAIAYVACDPASLGRDLSLFLRSNYELISLQAFDLFPRTHHVECVAILGAQRA